MNHRFGEFGEDLYKNAATAAQQVEEGAVEVSAEIQREAKQWLSHLEQQIVKNPVLALGVALAVGLTVGVMCKRS